MGIFIINVSMSEECDEILIYMDFNSKVEDDLFSPEKEFKIIGLNTDEPVLQLGNQVFQGEWKDSIGTHIFFEEGVPVKTDPLFSEPPPRQFYCKTKTNKMLHMSRIFVNPKGNNADTSNKNEDNRSEKDMSEPVSDTS